MPKSNFSANDLYNWGWGLWCMIIQGISLTSLGWKIWSQHGHVSLTSSELTEKTIYSMFHQVGDNFPQKSVVSELPNVYNWVSIQPTHLRNNNTHQITRMASKTWSPKFADAPIRCITNNNSIPLINPSLMHTHSIPKLYCMQRKG